MKGLVCTVKSEVLQESLRVRNDTNGELFIDDFFLTEETENGFAAKGGVLSQVLLLVLFRLRQLL